MEYMDDAISIEKNHSVNVGFSKSAYVRAGVDIDEGEKFVETIKPFIKSTSNPFVLSDIGGFGGLYSLSAFGNDTHILVASVDGVGTKTRTARFFGKFDTVGQDLINHCVNDILTIGARPLFALDYLAMHKLSIKEHSEVIRGLSIAAKNHRIPIIGGETAEMNHVYRQEEFDLAAFVIGVVEKNKMLTGDKISDGDLVLGLPSTGLHTNGYSLVNQLIVDGKIKKTEDNATKYLSIHKSYFDEVMPLIDLGIINGIAHITGGGFSNILRILPTGLTVKLKLGSWMIPDEFREVQVLGNVPGEEMLRVFNLGIGMVLIVSQENLRHMIHQYGFENFYVIGHVMHYDKKEVLYA